MVMPPCLSSVPHRSGENEREVVYNPLKMVDGIYEMDFDHLESIIDDKCKVLILCNLTIRAGSSGKMETLVRLAEIWHQAQIFFGYLR